MKWFISALLAALFVFSSPSNAAPSRIGNDFNGDGTSDLIDIEIAEQGALNWSVSSGSDLAPITGASRSAFGQAGNHVTSAKWFSGTLTTLSFAELKGSRIVWNALTTAGALRKKNFGTRNSFVISGADFNGNGISDAAIIEPLSNGEFEWRIAPDFFKSRRPRIIRKHGKTGDVPFFAAYAGSRDWLAVLRARTSSDYRILLRHPTGSARRVIALGSLPAGSLRPMPVAQAQGGDLIAFAKRSQSSTTFTFINMQGQTVDEKTFPLTGEVIAGNFLADSGGEIGIMGDGTITFYNPATKESSTQSWTHSIVSDHININTFDSDNPEEPEPGPRTPRDNPPPAAGSLTQVCTNMHFMNRDVLFKPASQDTGDSREGKPLFMWYDAEDNPYVKQLYILASNGRQISIFGHYTPGLPPWTRFYSGYPPGLGDNSASLTAKAIAQAGNKKIYIYTENGNCWGPVPDPAGRSGGR